MDIGSTSGSTMTLTTNNPKSSSSNLLTIVLICIVGVVAVIELILAGVSFSRKQHGTVTIREEEERPRQHQMTEYGPLLLDTISGIWTIFMKLAV